LHTFPCSGRKVPELDDDAIREIIEVPYRVIYRLASQRIEVMTVLHGSRLLRWPPD
jgi:plasmid stabilization system protein ParE